MSKDNTAKGMEKNNLGGLGEISTIRDILMGQHINTYDEKFQAIENSIQEMNARLMNELTRIEEDNAKQRAVLRAELTSRIDHVEKAMNEGLARLDKKLASSSTEERKKLGEMFGNMANQLQANISTLID